MKNNIIYTHLVLLLLLLLPFISRSQTIPDKIARNSSKIESASGYTDKITLLTHIGDLYLELNDWNGRDSFYSMAANIAQQKDNDSVERKIYRSYFDADNAPATTTAEIFSNRLMELAHGNDKNDYLFDAYYAAAKICLSQGNYAMAVKNANSTLHATDLEDGEKIKVRGSLLLGDCFSNNNDKLEAFRQYSSALYIALKNEDSSSAYNCYGHLSSFYNAIGNTNMALVYKNKQLRQLPATGNDSMVLMNLYNDLANIYYNKGDKRSGELYTNQVLDYAFRNNAIRLKNTAFSIYRSYLVDNNSFSSLYDLYIRRYPLELISIGETDKALYYRLNAYMQEVKGNNDSARAYYSLAEERLANCKDNAFLSNFYKRYGQFLLRNEDFSNARIKFETAYRYAIAAKYYPFLVETTAYLDSINVIQKNYQEAYKYSSLNKNYTAQLALTIQEDELLRLEVNSEKQHQELALEKEEQRKEQRHSIQYIAIIIVITSVFVVLAMLGSFKVPKFVIKAIGFFSFLLLFEFIVMVADFKIEHITHGEPYKVLMIKICIIALLTPLHHWLEHKVLHFLYEHKLIDTSKLRSIHILHRLWKKEKPEVSGN